MLRTLLSAMRIKAEKMTLFRVAQEQPSKELLVETWRGDWTPIRNAGAAFVGVLRDAGLSKEQITDIIQHAQETNEQAEQ